MKFPPGYGYPTWHDWQWMNYRAPLWKRVFRCFRGIPMADAPQSMNWHLSEVFSMTDFSSSTDADELRQFADRFDRDPVSWAFSNAMTIAERKKIAAALRGAAQAASEHLCVPGREDLMLIAHEIREAKNAYLDGMGQQGNADRKEKLSQVLHDNATDIATALDAFALAYTAKEPERRWTEDELGLAFFDYSACTERRCGWTEPGDCDCRNAARRAVHWIKHVLPRSFPLASSVSSTPLCTPSEGE